MIRNNRPYGRQKALRDAAMMAAQTQDALVKLVRNQGTRL
jgi:hypothetical protein